MYLFWLKRRNEQCVLPMRSNCWRNGRRMIMSAGGSSECWKQCKKLWKLDHRKASVFNIKRIFRAWIKGLTVMNVHCSLWGLKFSSQTYIRNSQPSVSLASRDLTPASGFHQYLHSHAYTHTQSHTYTYKFNNFWKKIHIFSFLIFIVS